MQREGEQSANYLNTKLTGVLATGPAIVDQSGPVQSCMQDLTKQGEELKEVMVREALVRHPDFRQAGARLPSVRQVVDGLETLPPQVHKRPHYPSIPRRDGHAPVSSVAYLPDTNMSV